eukprot:c18753_g1_i4.p2 GENE.c18753_g1_i4~~c18753_g1_i4.p2  ORF type:complete len:105 (+),score=14.10 c18753_g1_i4:233-547(+)
MCHTPQASSPLTNDQTNVRFVDVNFRQMKPTQHLNHFNLVITCCEGNWCPFTLPSKFLALFGLRILLGVLFTHQSKCQKPGIFTWGNASTIPNTTFRLDISSHK